MPAVCEDRWHIVFRGDKAGRGYVHLSVCTGDPVYDEISSFDYSDGYVAEGVANCTIFPL